MATLERSLVSKDSVGCPCCFSCSCYAIKHKRYHESSSSQDFRRIALHTNSSSSSSSSKMLTITKTKKRRSKSNAIKFSTTTTTTINRWPCFSALLLIVCCALSNSMVAHGGPPLDYFTLTSQPASSQQNHNNVSLPSISSIYSSPEANLTKGSGATHLQQVAQRVESLIRNSSHTHDNDLVDLEATRLAWHLMEKQAMLYTSHMVEQAKPILDKLLEEAKVSPECQQSVDFWLSELRQLKYWSSLMWNSWGKFPAAGLFQGSYTDLGSYSSCMRVDDLNQADKIGQAQYCMLDFQPLVPTRPRFHSIFKRILDVDPIGQLTGGDFSDLEANVLRSRHDAHGYPSTRFSELSRSSELKAAAAASSAKYTKRTIDSSVPAGNNSSTLTQDALANQQELNLTLKAEALIELAQRAQYFYYVKFRIGACLPSKCSQQDVKQLAQVAGQRAILQSVQVNCMKKEPFTMNNYQLVAIWILSSLALVAIFGTIVDLLGFKEDLQSSGSLVNWLLPFSLWTNARRLFDLEAAGTHSDLECVHGLRFFSMIWVIYGHTILYMEYQSFTHFYNVVEKQIPSFLLLPTLNANFSVDTFFVISGILTTYVTWEYTKGDPRKFNKFAFTISRYIRLTPQLAIVILCFFLLPLFGDGPMYKQVADKEANLCYKGWATNLLYLQSYTDSEKICIDPSWWLSIEMTFHVVSMVVIIVMIQNVRRGMIVNFLVASVLTLWGAIIHYTNGFAIQYLPSIPQRYEVSHEQTHMFFHRPYPHAASYFIGIALGYVLANRTIKKLSVSQLVQGWCVCAFGIIVSLWGGYYWNLGAPYTQLQATLYYNFCQIMWPISIAWIILACSLGHGGFVNSILSARCFVPLGRVTYMTYLSHALIIYYHSGSMNIPVEPSMLLFIYLFIANTGLALALGVILTVVYESPILNLQKQLFTYLTQRFDPTLENNSAKRAINGGGGELRSKEVHNHIDMEQTAATIEHPFQAKNGLTGPTANCLLLNPNQNKPTNNCNGMA